MLLQCLTLNSLHNTKCVVQLYILSTTSILYAMFTQIISNEHKTWSSKNAKRSVVSFVLTFSVHTCTSYHPFFILVMHILFYILLFAAIESHSNFSFSSSLFGSSKVTRLTMNLSHLFKTNTICQLQFQEHQFMCPLAYTLFCEWSKMHF